MHGLHGMHRIALFLAAGLLLAQQPAPLALIEPVKDKNFYALSLLERDPALRAALAKDAPLATLTAAKRQALLTARGECKALPACYADRLALTASEIDAIADRLKALAATPVDGPLRRSGIAIRQHNLVPADLLDRVWRDAAQHINRIASLYAKGEKPRYPAIDSAVYEVTSPLFGNFVERMVEWMAAGQAEFDLPWSVSQRFAVELMQAHHRDEAGRYEPMEMGENRAAVERAATIRWSDYPYSAILVPGSGSDRPNIPLSPYGRLRCQIAARRYEQHQAPFLIVSGGHVHPNQTPFAEAIEMKRLLMREFHIPASAIIIDPHARHTTTNVRNAARLMFRYGMPMDKPALITSDGSQSAYIEAPGFAERCRKELGYLPYKNLKRLNPFDLEWLPVLDSLQMDAIEPLDP